MQTINLIKKQLLLLILFILSSLFIISSAHATEFCWKDSYGRGVGTIPTHCGANEVKIGAFCYAKCDRNMKRFGFDCHSVCPKGMENQGLFCRLNEYGRGAGFPWQFGDALNDNGMIKRCEKKHGKGNCEKNGLIYYPKCKAGYEAFGCCICRPKRPNCSKLGLGNQFDLSCEKKIKIGKPMTAKCSYGKTYDAGLCYTKCDKGYQGVGPVCWGQKPKGWVNCGMGAAKNSATCASIVTSQVSSVGQMAYFVGSLGTSSAASSSSSAAQSAGKMAKLKQDFDKLKKSWDQIKDTPKVQKAITQAQNANKVRKGYNATQALEAATTEEDMVRVSAQIAAILDPTGVSATVAAYTYATCSKYFSDQYKHTQGNTSQPSTKTTDHKHNNTNKPTQNHNQLSSPSNPTTNRPSNSYTASNTYIELSKRDGHSDVFLYTQDILKTNQYIQLAQYPNIIWKVIKVQNNQGQTKVYVLKTATGSMHRLPNGGDIRQKGTYKLITNYQASDKNEAVKNSHTHSGSNNNNRDNNENNNKANRPARHPYLELSKANGHNEVYLYTPSNVILGVKDILKLKAYKKLTWKVISISGRRPDTNIYLIRTINNVPHQLPNQGDIQTRGVFFVKPKNKVKK